MFYVLDDNHNLIEAYDKEGVLALLEQAIENGDLTGIASDSAFVDKLKCAVGGGTHKVAFVTQAKYNELEADNQLITNCYYFITDDTTCEDIDAQLETINNSITDINIRLAALGFNEGAFEVSGISSAQVTANSIKKQGKYIIANLTIILMNSSYSNLQINLPSGFRPNAQTNIMLGYSNAYGNFYKSVTVNDSIDLTTLPTSGLFGITILNAAWEIA